MRITIESWSAPICKCGEKMEIYVDVHSQRIRVKCIYCGFEQSCHTETGVGSFKLFEIADAARLLIE